jgi:hypothetical protein
MFMRQHNLLHVDVFRFNTEDINAESKTQLHHNINGMARRNAKETANKKFLRFIKMIITVGVYHDS